MSMALCNGIATRFKCDRVSLGWLKGGFIRLKAVSHTEKFDRQMAAAQSLESAMEETFDQDDEIVFPAPEAATVISKDHQRFAEDLKVPYLCSLPLRAGDRPVAVIFCERRTASFTQVELQQMRLGADLIAARLADLQHRELWFGARWNLAARERAARWLGPEHTWAKVVAVGMSALLLLLIFLRVPYRVEGNFTLRSEELSYLTAPFEGFIEQVLARPGDHVASNAPLVRLKTTELELEESFAAADLNRYQRETEKARAGRALADMRIAEAMAQEARARLETVRYRQSQATIRSPFAGVIVEGDLREHLGAPVKTAEVLLKVARIDTLYVEAEVNERDIHEVLGKSTGEIAFVSQPKLKFPVRIQTVEQAAMPKTEANVFLIRCAVQQAAPPWWRPGMSGVCKLDVEKRSLLWILTHRTIDFIRLKLWW
jgi:multidrug resistance efflux pump